MHGTQLYLFLARVMNMDPALGPHVADSLLLRLEILLKSGINSPLNYSLCSNLLKPPINSQVPLFIHLMDIPLLVGFLILQVPVDLGAVKTRIPV